MEAVVSGALPAASVKVVATVMMLVASSMLSVGVKVAVHVTPASADETGVSVPLAKVMSVLSKLVTASENVMVSVAVSPTLSAESESVTELMMGSVVSMV